jgi:hypothetical protein
MTTGISTVLEHSGVIEESDDDMTTGISTVLTINQIKTRKRAIEMLGDGDILLG